MYERFAQVYDHLMGDFDYPGWARHYLALLGRAGVSPRRVCDVACGTGSIALELAALGLEVTGVDASPEMLREAQNKARAMGRTVPFVRQDMRDLQLHRAVDAIVCACDGVNYLLTEDDLSRFFAAAHKNLAPGGALAFDISSGEKLREQARERIFFEDLPNLTYLWQNEWDEGTQTVSMDLCFFERRSDGLYARFDERQAQRAHESDALGAALRDAGFRDVRAYGGRTFDPPAPGEPRIHFTAVKD